MAWTMSLLLAVNSVAVADVPRRSHMCALNETLDSTFDALLIFIRSSKTWHSWQESNQTMMHFLRVFMLTISSNWKHRWNNLLSSFYVWMLYLVSQLKAVIAEKTAALIHHQFLVPTEMCVMWSLVPSIPKIRTYIYRIISHQAFFFCTLSIQIL